MEFDINQAIDVKPDYLVVKEIGYGRIAYWAKGCKKNISEDENKLFINIVPWYKLKYKFIIII